MKWQPAKVVDEKLHGPKPWFCNTILAYNNPSREIPLPNNRTTPRATTPSLPPHPPWGGGGGGGLLCTFARYTSDIRRYTPPRGHYVIPMQSSVVPLVPCVVPLLPYVHNVMHMQSSVVLVELRIRASSGPSSVELGSAIILHGMAHAERRYRNRLLVQPHRKVEIQ